MTNCGLEAGGGRGGFNRFVHTIFVFTAAKESMNFDARLELHTMRNPSEKITKTWLQCRRVRLKRFRSGLSTRLLCFTSNGAIVQIARVLEYARFVLGGIHNEDSPTRIVSTAAERTDVFEVEICIKGRFSSTKMSHSRSACKRVFFRRALPRAPKTASTAGQVKPIPPGRSS